MKYYPHYNFENIMVFYTVAYTAVSHRPSPLAASNVQAKTEERGCICRLGYLPTYAYFPIIPVLSELTGDEWCVWKPFLLSVRKPSNDKPFKLQSSSVPTLLFGGVS